MSRSTFFRKTHARNLVGLASLITCAILITSSRMGKLETVCLQNRRLKGSGEATMPRSGESILEAESLGPSHNASTGSTSYSVLQEKNNFELKQEVEELKRKLKMYERLNSFTELDSHVNKHGSKTRQNIFLVSDMRAGSSFLGEMFNQHPEVFYLYEPVQALDYYRENRLESVYDTMVTHMLNGIFHCNFLDLSYLTDFLSYQYSSLRHRLASKALSSPPLCPEDFHPSYSIRTCTPLKTQTVSAICRLHKHTVVKTVQLKYIHKLSYLMDSEGPTDYSLKVVHLVRDPRAILNSRVTKESSLNRTVTSLKEYARGLCHHMLRNIKYAVSAPSWLQGRYTLLRYEDLATSPHQIAEQLYKFVGINILPRVRMWIDRATTEGFTSVSLGDSVSQPLSYRAQNLIDSVQKWRLQMPYSIVRMVETECYEVMNLLGYSIVDDEEELRTISLPLRE